MIDINIHQDCGQIDINQLNQFEEFIGHKLPDSYRALLSEHNALIPTESIFDFVDRTSGKTGKRDIAFYGFGNHLPKKNQIKEAQNHGDIGHTGLITIGETTNGDFICFDYKSMPELTEPLIAMMFHNRRDIHGKMLVNYIADSFEDFLQMLHA